MSARIANSKTGRLCGLRIAAVAVALLVGIAPAAVRAKSSWDHIANIKTSAVHLAELQTQKGALGAFQFIAACYQTHELAEDYGAPLEGCIVQDYIHSKVTAAVYSKVPAEQREKMGLPSPEELMKGMLGRLGGAMAKYKLTEADARKFIADIDTYGIPAFAEVRFKKAE